METFKLLVFDWRCWLNPEMGGAEVFTYENAKKWTELTVIEEIVIK